MVLNMARVNAYKMTALLDSRRRKGWFFLYAKIPHGKSCYNHKQPVFIKKNVANIY